MKKLLLLFVVLPIMVCAQNKKATGSRSPAPLVDSLTGERFYASNLYEFAQDGKTFYLQRNSRNEVLLYLFFKRDTYAYIRPGDTLYLQLTNGHTVKLPCTKPATPIGRHVGGQYLVDGNAAAALSTNSIKGIRQMYAGSLHQFDVQEADRPAIRKALRILPAFAAPAPSSLTKSNGD